MSAGGKRVGGGGRVLEVYIRRLGGRPERKDQKMGQKTQMPDDVQEVVARWVFGGDLYTRTDWGWSTEFARDIAWATKVDVGAVLRMCGGVGRVWRKALVEWRSRQVARATQEMWGLAVAQAVDLVGRHRYPTRADGVPAVTKVECALWVEGRMVVQGRFERTGEMLVHWLTAEVWRGEERESVRWRKETEADAWWGLWQGWEVSDKLDRWEAAAVRELEAWCAGV